MLLLELFNNFATVGMIKSGTVKIMDETPTFRAFLNSPLNVFGNYNI